MQLLRLHAISDTFNLPAIALTIGNFDGVHLGHQAMLCTLKKQAQQAELATMVMIFEPQPREFFTPDNAPPRITSLREKVMLLRTLGVDYVLVARFNHTFKNLTATAFVELLRHRLNVKHLVIGDDFRFGHDRTGDHAFLERHGVHVTAMQTVKTADERISSTRVRRLLLEGDFANAAKLLGRPYSMSGRVVHGDAIGRTLNFPTANIALHRPTPCLHGIYGVDVTWLDGDINQLNTGHVSHKPVAGYHQHSLFAAANIGTRPAIKQPIINKLGGTGREWRLEVFIPQFNANLYGKRLQVTFLHFLHGEKDYPNVEALRQGIHQDVARLLEWRQGQLVSPV